MRLLIVDDHPLFSEGLRLLLEQHYADLSCEHAATMSEALARLGSCNFDLLLTDLNLPDSLGLDSLRALRQAAPQTPCVVISADDRAETVLAAIDEGAAGYVPKTANYAEMLGALKRVMSGGVVLPERALKEMQTTRNAGSPKIFRQNALDELTPRQREVLQLLMQGKPNKLICRALDLSEATIKTHLAAIFRVLEVNSRTEAVIVAARSGSNL